MMPLSTYPSTAATWYAVGYTLLAAALAVYWFGCDQS
jgi:hypothetical protein